MQPDVIFSCFKFNIFIFIYVQCSSQSDPTSANQQVQLLLGEKQQLEAHNHQVCVDIHLKKFCISAQCFVNYSKACGSVAEQ